MLISYTSNLTQCESTSGLWYFFQKSITQSNHEKASEKTKQNKTRDTLQILLKFQGHEKKKKIWQTANTFDWKRLRRQVLDWRLHQEK